MHDLFRVAVFLVSLAIGNGLLASEVFYGIRGNNGNTGLGNPSDLITINVTTGSLDSIIGVSGISGIGGFAINPLDHTFYAIGGGKGTAGLHTLNPTSGLATLIGGGVRAKDMGFNSSGILYALMANNGIGTANELATINLATGDITSIGGSFSGSAGLAFNASNVLFIKEGTSLHIVDSLTAAIISTTLIDKTLQNALAFDENDVLYSFSPSINRIHTIDVNTGATTAFPNTIPLLDNPNGSDIRLSAIDFSRIAPSPTIPSPATLALVCLGLAGIRYVRKKQAA